jgi:hypothetical protein
MGVKMLKFDKNDIKALEENTKQKLVLVENNYRGTTFKNDLKNKMLNRDKLRIVKKISNK